MDLSSGSARASSDWLELGSQLYAVSDFPNRFSGDVDAWADSVATAQQWAYLDHDAKLSVEMLVQRLPFDVASCLAFAPGSIEQEEP